MTGAVYACISCLYRQILSLGWVDLNQYMSVYGSIFIKNTCIYINQYMNVFPTVYLTVFLYVFLAVYLAVFLYVFPTVSCCIFRAHSQPSRCRHGCFAFACAGARSTFAARSLLRQMSRGSASAGRPLNSIRSGLRD